MANYRDVGIADAPFIAGEDLTQKTWFVVRPGSIVSEVRLGTGGCNPAPLGIVTNSPSTGQEASVRIMGFSKAVCRAAAASLNYGSWLVCASDGVLEPMATAGGSAVMARYFDTAVITGSVIAQVQLLGFSSCAFGAAS